METLGNKIYKLRRKAGLSQEEFASKVGVTRQSVSNWETDSLLPRMEKLTLLCGLFGVSLDYFLPNGAKLPDEKEVEASIVIAESPIEKTERKKLSKKAVLLISLSVFAIIFIVLVAVVCIGLFTFPKDGDYTVQSVSFGLTSAATTAVVVIAALILIGLNVFFIFRSLKKK